MPAIVMAAFLNDLKPAIDAHPFLQHGCSRRSSHKARWLGTCPSSVTLRGTRGRLVASALRKNACAAAIPRWRRSRKSTVLENRSQRFWNSGTYRVTHRRRAGGRWGHGRSASSFSTSENGPRILPNVRQCTRAGLSPLFYNAAAGGRWTGTLFGAFKSVAAGNYPVRKR